MKRILPIFLMLACALSSYAQRYSFYNLSVENGLIQSQVMSMVQDSYGHLWVGTLGGLARYDGTHFTNFNVRDGLLDNRINSVTTDKDGNIWVGGREGVSVFDGRKFRHYRLKIAENTLGNNVNSVQVGADNTVWCSTDSNIYTIRNGKIATYTLPALTGKISAILPVKDTLWLATDDGKLLRHAGKKWDSLFFNMPGQPKAPVTTTSIYKDSKNRLLLTTRTGFFKVNGNAIEPYVVKGQPLYYLPALSIAEDKEGALWLGSSGAFRIKDSSVHYYNKKSGFTDNVITHILTDAEGSVWFGSNGQGLYRYSGSQFSILDENSNLPSGQVMSIAPTKNGNLYIGTFDAGLYFYSKGEVSKVPLKQESLYITALDVSGEYDVWIGTDRLGLLRLKGPEKIYYNNAALPGNALITSLYRDNANRLWIGTNNGTVLYEADSFKRIAKNNEVVYAFISIGTDSVLIAENERILLYHNGIVKPFITKAAPDSSNAQCFTMLGRKLWIGTSDNGIICYDLNTGKSFTVNKSNGLQSDFIYNIITDNKGDIWAGTGYGIHKVHMHNGRPQVTFYGKEQGITGMESNQNAVCKMPDGTLWFGTTKGAVHIFPDKQFTQSQPISVILQSVKVFGEDITDTTYYDSTDKWYDVPYQLHLPYKKNNITFTFRGVTLAGMGQLFYRYRIDGLDAPWSDWTTLNSVTYSALPPGKYTLRVESKTINNAQVKTLTYPFEIITPLHKTRWFSLMILAACILAGIAIQYVINRRKQNRLALVDKLRREEQGKVRQRTAEDFHDEVGNKLTRINILTNVLKEKLGGELSSDKKRIIDQIQENTTALYGGTRDILWSLQATNDSLYEILHRIRDFGIDLFSDTNINFTFTGTDTAWQKYKLPLDMSRNLIMIFKEALNNCLKYANATEVHLHAELKEGHVLHVTLTDNGKGFAVEEVVKGNGLNNMRNRTTRLKGKLYIDSKEDRGTVINLHFRLPAPGKG